MTRAANRSDIDDLPDGADGDLLADTALQADPEIPDRYRATITESWRVFQALGGVTFGVAHRAAREHLDRPDLRPATASALFCAPVPPGPVTVDVDVLRNGRSAAQVVADLRLPDRTGTAVHLQATFAQARDDGLSFTETAFPEEAGRPEDGSPPPPPPPDDPFADIAFHRQTDWVVGMGRGHWDGPFPPGPGRAAAWTRLLRPPLTADGRYDPIGICVYADSIGLAMGQALGGDRRFFTLTLEMGIRFVAEQHTPWVLQHMRAWESTDGCGSGVTELWDVDRRLLAVATQTARLRTDPITSAPGPG